MNTLVLILVCALLLTPFLNRLYFLAPTRFGSLYYYSNILAEFFVRRLHLPRWVPDVGLFAAANAVFLIFLPQCALGILIADILLLLLDLVMRKREFDLMGSVFAHEDGRPRLALTRKDPTYHVGAYPHPAPHPDLVLNLEGPFVARTPRYDLGDLALGREVELTLLVANHSVVDESVPGEVRVEVSSALAVESNGVHHIPVLRSGDIHRLVLKFVASNISGAGTITLRLTHSDVERTLVVRYRSIMDPASQRLDSAVITRYPGGCRSAFAWRGDMDHYCRPTFQSIDGLTQTLGLAARYRFPQTMFTSSRLVVDQDSATNYYETLGVQRGQEEVGDFLSWFNSNVTLRHDLAYPFEVPTPYAMELGNHGHLHFGTDAAAAEENNWTFAARMGAGNYPWVSPGADSFTEQRDNAIECGRQFQKHFGFTPKSWAMPDSTNDEFTSRAMEAAGCEVLSDSDISHKDNVLFQPPPHHPVNCSSVELTKRYPGDPETIYHVDMIAYWIHRAHRLSIPVVFMCHQHMRQYMGHACPRFTEAVIRYALTDFNGDLHINTVYGIGKYWKQVLSPTHRVVSITIENDVIHVSNSGDYPLKKVPVDLTYAGGRRATVLVDLEPGERRSINAGNGMLRERD